VGRRTDEVLRVLDALQTGGLCPSDWERETAPLDPTAVLGPDSVLGPYHIEAELGRGSFGAVYRARDSVLQRTVALKVLRPGATASEDMLREARAAAALLHPNVCTVFSVDAGEGVPLIVMEYLDGRPLSKVLEAGPLPPGRAAALGRQVAQGMAEAHARGIVHGDLKPANVMITTNEVAKILDFGLARRDPLSASVQRTLEWDPQAPEGLSGTPAYMAPEQAAGRPLTPASDVFSLGLILYEMLTGRQAIRGDGLLEVLRKIDQVEAEAYAAEVAEPFASVLRQALVIDPLRRQIPMSEIASRLE
jgi:serine/threonine protein kinase